MKLILGMAALGICAALFLGHAPASQAAVYSFEGGPADCYPQFPEHEDSDFSCSAKYSFIIHDSDFGKIVKLPLGYMDLHIGAYNYKVPVGNHDEFFPLMYAEARTNPQGWLTEFIATCVDCLGDGAYHNSVLILTSPFTLLYFSDDVVNYSVFGEMKLVESPRPAPIPLPAGLPLLLACIGLLASARSRRVFYLPKGELWAAKPLGRLASSGC